MTRKQKLQRKNWAAKGRERHYQYPYKKIYGILVRSAKKRGIPCNITYEQYVKLTETKNCHYCGDELVWEKHGESASRTNVDRKNNDLGYTVRNCIPSCPRCNQSKNIHFSYPEWYAMTEVLRSKK